MNETEELLHPGDNIVLTNEFNFTDPMFDLTEPDIPTLGFEFLTVVDQIRKMFKGFDNLLKLGHINARSIPKHVHEIERVIEEFDALGVCETFMSKDTPLSICKIPGYNLVHKARDLKCRGGVGLYLRETIEYKVIKLPVNHVQPELLFVEITIGKIKIAIGVMYKSPLIPYSTYASIHENLAFVTSRYQHCVLMGDMNVDMLKPDSAAARFLSTYVIEPFALTQVIDEPTRITSKSSTLIDLMLTTSHENVKVHGVVDTPGISDHCLVFSAYSIKKPKFKPKMVTRRDFRNFNENAFKADMGLAPWGNIHAVDDEDIDNKVVIFENIHRDLMDKHAPFRTFRVTRPATPWLNDEIKSLMDNRDKYKKQIQQR